MLRFTTQLSSRSTALLLAANGLLFTWGGSSGCSTYSTDLLQGSGLANGGNTTTGVSGNAPSTNAGAAGTDTAHAGSEAVGEGGVGGEGNESGGGAKAGSGGSTTTGGGGTTGGTSGTAGSGVAGFGTTGGATTVSSDLIDDFEDGDKVINIIANPRRDGIWDTNNDMTVGGTESPAPAMFVPAELDAATAPYMGDAYAAHLTGKGFTSFGAYMNVSMRAVADYPNTPYYDASGYKGISFIAKVGSTASATKAMRVRFISGDTDPRGKKCMTSGAQNTLCYNHYYASVTLTTAWKLYQINFSDFVQGADGMVNASIDTKEMYGMEFYFATSTTFDLWLDDLTFFK